jgi:hypothetical protein
VNKPVIRLGAHEFRSKDAARKFVSKALHGARLGPASAELDAVLRDLLEHHPEAAEKIGCGVDFFEVAVDETWKSRQFHAVRLDGTRTRFSYIACFESDAVRYAIQQAKRALRNAIAPQIVAFRDARVRGGGRVVDEVTGELIPEGELHVDHAPPEFDKILHGWLAERGHSLAALAIVPHGDTSTPTHLADEAISLDWQRYHLDRARLRLVARQTNLSLLRRGA